MEKINEGNLSLAYCATHTFKHVLGNEYDQRESKPIVRASLRDLWELRFHPNFLGNDNSRELQLSTLLDLDIKLLELEGPYGFSHQFRKEYRGLPDNLLIPDVTDNFREGLLTDKIRQAKQKLIDAKAILPNEEEAREVLDLYKMDLSLEELRKRFLDKHAYGMFIVGFTFSMLGKDSKAEEAVKQFIRF